MSKSNTKRERHVLYNILNKMPRDELLDLYYSQLGDVSKINQTAKKQFIIDKIINTIDADIIIKNQKLNKYMFNEINNYYEYFNKLLNNFTQEELKKIYADYDDKNSGDLKKEKMITNILFLYGIDNLMKNKIYKEKTTPSHFTKTQIETIYKNINNLNVKINEINNLYSKINFNLESNLKEIIWSEYDKLHKEIIVINESLNKKGNINDMIEKITLFSIKENINKRDINYNSLDGSLNKLNYEEFNKILILLKIMALDYLVKNVNKIDKKLFIDVLKEEFDKIKMIDNKAEIPKLRKNVCMRMNISPNEFDDLIEEEWRRGALKLDIGAPIGERNVEYLITREGTRYYYISFRM